MILEVRYGQDIYDLATLSGYTIDNIYALIQANPIVTSIDFDFEANPGITINYDPTFRIAAAPQLVQKVVVPPSSIVSFTAIDQQNIYDLVLQSYGSLNNIYRLILENGISNINDQLLAGRTINFNTDFISDNGFYDSLKKRNIKIATGIVVTPSSMIRYRVTDIGIERIIQTSEQRIVT